MIVESGQLGCPSASTEALLAVYYPDGGFVTGGGWIDSPTGAYGNEGNPQMLPKGDNQYK